MASSSESISYFPPNGGVIPRPKKNGEPDLTLSNMYKIIKGWQKRLDLGRWLLMIDTDDEGVDGEESYAEIKRHDYYHTAQLSLAPSFPEWDREFANVIVLHELLHLAQRDMWVIATRTAIPSAQKAKKKKKATTLRERFYERAEEEYVHRMAMALVRELGVI